MCVCRGQRAECGARQSCVESFSTEPQEATTASSAHITKGRARRPRLRAVARTHSPPHPRAGPPPLLLQRQRRRRARHRNLRALLGLRQTQRVQLLQQGFMPCGNYMSFACDVPHLSSFSFTSISSLTDCMHAEGREQNAEGDSLARRAFLQSPQKQLPPPQLTSQKSAPAVLASGPMPTPALKPAIVPGPAAAAEAARRAQSSAADTRPATDRAAAPPPAKAAASTAGAASAPAAAASTAAAKVAAFVPAAAAPAVTPSALATAVLKSSSAPAPAAGRRGVRTGFGTPSPAPPTAGGSTTARQTAAPGTSAQAAEATSACIHAAGVAVPPMVSQPPPHSACTPAEPTEDAGGQNGVGEKREVPVQESSGSSDKKQRTQK